MSTDTYPYRYNFDAHTTRAAAAAPEADPARFLTVRIGEPVIATSAGKRRGELRDMGLLFDTGFRGPTETGPKKAVRWGLTPAGEMEVAA